MMETKWQSKSGKFTDIYQAEVMRALTGFDTKTLDALLRWLDYEVHILGASSLATEDARERDRLSGAARQMNNMTELLRNLWEKKQEPEEKPEPGTERGTYE